jgi:predicted ester cyclase
MLFQRGVKAVTEKTFPLKKGDEGGFECDVSRGHRLDLLNELWLQDTSAGRRRTNGEAIMSIEANKAIVKRYFEEVLDERKLDILDELVAADCVIHRPEAEEPIRGLEAFRQALERILQVYSEFTTTIHDLIAEDDRVVFRLSHQAVNRGEWTSRIGTHAVAGKAVSWPAIVIFRIRDGKIAEEWVSRDELGMLIQLGVLPSIETSK